MKVTRLFNYLTRPFHKKVILFLDDDDCLQLLIERVLSSIDKKITLKWVKDTESAKAFLKKTSPSLIIVDYVLNETKTGLDFWNYCQKEYGQIPFILTSSVEGKIMYRYMSQEGAPPPFLQKPFYMKECEILIRDLLSE